MKKVLKSLIIAILFLSSCTHLSDGPKRTYFEFEEFCAKGDLRSATLLVTQQRIDENQKSGVCILSPNNYYYGLFETDIFILDDPNPEVEIHGGIALLTWRTSDSKIIMIMDEIDRIWKIRTTLVDPESTVN